MNKEEAIIGAIIGLGFIPLLGLSAIPLAFTTAFLYERGGSGWLGTKAWRRYGVPTAILLFVGWQSVLVSVITFVLNVIILSIGYGTKSVQPPDEGSLFGNWCVRVAGSETGGKWLARGIIVGGIWAIWVIILWIQSSLGSGHPYLVPHV